MQGLQASLPSLSPQHELSTIHTKFKTFNFLKKYLIFIVHLWAYKSTPDFSSADHYCSPGNSIRGVYSMHLNAFYDLTTHTYTDVLIQPIHSKNEFGAFCDMVDRHEIQKGRKNVYIGDRGYCSYNNMAHVIEQGQFFLFRAKDIRSKGLAGNFDFPQEESFDIDVRYTLVRSHSGKVPASPGTYRRFVDQASAFDYISYGSHDTYGLAFRIMRSPLSDSSYECIVTNLPRDKFPPERIKELYYADGGLNLLSES